MSDEISPEDFVKVLKSRVKKDWDAVVGITGEEGCQPAGSKVLMSNGEWKNIENIMVGDKVLSPQENGKHIISKVIKTNSWFCDDIYDVKHLNRNNKKLYSCSYNHQIPIHRKFFPRYKGIRKVEDSYWTIKHYTAQEYSKLSRLGSKKNQTTFTSFPIKKYEGIKNSTIEPYCLGVWLGDGHFSSKRKLNKLYKGNLRKGCNQNGKWISRACGITSNDPEIIDEVKKFYDFMKIQSKQSTTTKTYMFSLLSPFVQELIRLGFEGKGSGEKFIPRECLLSDLEYRKRLLAGIVDTDGTLRKDGNSYSVTSKSPQFIQDIYSLVRSIGGRGSITKRICQIKSTGFKGEYHFISFYLGKLRLPVKLNRKTAKENCFYLSPNRCSVDVVKSDKKEIVYGFTLDSPSEWYITDDWTITHNSSKSTLASWLVYLGCIADGLSEEESLKKFVDYTIFSPNKTRVQEQITKSERYSIINADEAIKILYKQNWATPIQKFLNMFYALCRQENKISILCMPRFLDFNEFFRNHRIKFWIHVLDRGVAVIFERDWFPSSADPWMLKESQKLNYMIYTKRKTGDFNTEQKVQALSRLKNFIGVIRFDDLPNNLKKVYKDGKAEFAYEDLEEQIKQGDIGNGAREDKWKNQIEEVILTMYQDGKNGMEISRTTGIAKSTIYEVIKGLNSSIPIPEQPLINNNHSKEDNFDDN